MKLTPPAPPGSRPDVIRPRCGSPPTGCSTLMTSAPQSTSAAPPDGMNIQLATSMTRMPSSGPGTCAPLGSPRPGSRRSGRPGDRLGLGEDLQALDAALAPDARLLVAA